MHLTFFHINIFSAVGTLRENYLRRKAKAVSWLICGWSYIYDGFPIPHNVYHKFISDFFLKVIVGSLQRRQRPISEYILPSWWSSMTVHHSNMQFMPVNLRYCLPHSDRNCMSWSPQKMGHITQFFEGGRILYSIVCTFAKNVIPSKIHYSKTMHQIFPIKVQL